MNMETRRPITQTSAYLNLKQRITKGKIEDQRKINFELLDRIVQLSDRIDILEGIVKNVSAFMDNQNKISTLISDLPNKTKDALLEFQNYINGEIVPRINKLEKGDMNEGGEDREEKVAGGDEQMCVEGSRESPY